MCIKIIHTEDTQEFNPSEPLEAQIFGAKEIIVSYDPMDPKIDSFVSQVDRMVKNGMICRADIKVNSNNFLNGLKLERQLEKLKIKLDINEVVRGLTMFHADTDKKLCEMSEMCLGKVNE